MTRKLRGSWKIETAEEYLGIEPIGFYLTKTTREVVEVFRPRYPADSVLIEERQWHFKMRSVLTGEWRPLNVDLKTKLTPLEVLAHMARAP